MKNAEKLHFAETNNENKDYEKRCHRNGPNDILSNGLGFRKLYPLLKNC
jgi:hypothetical protein